MGWFRGLERQAIPCEKPIRLNDDPMRLKGPRPDHDILDPAVQQRLLTQEAGLAGPTGANVWLLAGTCSSFSDHQIGHGTRAWHEPCGDGSRESEVAGNAQAKLQAKLANCFDDAGKAWISESSKATGCYPKMWDLPEIAALRQRLGPRSSPPACARLLSSPQAAENQYHRKDSWFLVSKNLYPWLLLFIARPCQGGHIHLPIRGVPHFWSSHVSTLR